MLCLVVSVCKILVTNACLNGDEVTTVVSRVNEKAVTSKLVEMDDCTQKNITVIIIIIIIITVIIIIIIQQFPCV
jgi:hypothetical protein